MNYGYSDAAYEDLVYNWPDIKGAKWEVVPGAMDDKYRLQAEKLGLVVTISGYFALGCRKDEVTVEALQLVADRWSAKQ